MYIADKLRPKVRLCTEVPKSSVFEDLFARINMPKESVPVMFMAA